MLVVWLIMTTHSCPSTLVVEYAPRQDLSRTRKLRRYFTDIIHRKTDFTFIDLAKNPASPLTTEQVQAYYKRNYEGQELTPKEAKSLNKVDALRDQFMAHDVIIIAAPMYNFGFPAAVKAWIDCVVQKEHAYTHDAKGHVPLLGGKTVIIIYTAGIVFDQINENEEWNGIVSEGQKLFGYMGATVRVVHVQGVDMLGEKNIRYRTKNVAELKLNTLAKNIYDVDIALLTYEDVN